jgi:hypothetical protein
MPLTMYLRVSRLLSSPITTFNCHESSQPFRIFLTRSLTGCETIDHAALLHAMAAIAAGAARHRVIGSRPLCG